MPNPYPVALRERAVRAYEDSTDTYHVVAQRFAISVTTLLQWVQRARATGEITPRPKGGGWARRSTCRRCIGWWPPGPIRRPTS
jgi:transposase